MFEGNSFVMDAEGKVVMRAPAYEEGIYPVEFVRQARGKVRAASRVRSRRS